VTGRVVVVTGASAGIGRAVACAFGAKGDRVGLLARGETGLDGAVKDIERAGGQALAVPTDVADHGQVEVAAEQVEQTLGPIDIWVNVAFTSVFAPFTQIRPEEFKRVTEVSYLGYVYGTRAALDRMLARDHGTIVQVGSALAYRGFRCRPPTVAPSTLSRVSTRRCADSCCTSAARCGSQWCSFRRSTLPSSTGCSTGCPTVRARSRRSTSPGWPPGPSCTPPTTLKRREYWVGGSTVGTLMANKLVPGLLDRYLARTAYEAQQTDQPADPDRPVNLWEPVDGRGGRDFGAHGSFDDEAVNRSLQAWIGRHRGVAAAAGGLFGSLLALKFHRR
jgi:NAD(P)-dependent dehydrogenase (short-subunit alcohol dehydrogenase family)